MKLDQICEKSLPNFYTSKNVNGLKKKPKKLKKSVYGLPPLFIGIGSNVDGIDSGGGDGGGGE